MPFPVSMRGGFEFGSIGEAKAAAAGVTDRVERALAAVAAEDVERYDNTILFAGPALIPDDWSPWAAWTARPSTVLWVVARGEVEITPAPPNGGAGFVRYYLRTTRGVGVILLLMSASEILARLAGDTRLPPFLVPGLIGAIWTIQYLLAWIRVPLLLMRAADGERGHQATRKSASGHRDAEQPGT